MSQYFKSRDGLFVTVDCSDWSDFRLKMSSALCEEDGGVPLSGKFVFRGQSCSDWSLMSSFDRQMVHSAPADRDRVYRWLLDTFRKNYSTYGDISGNKIGRNFDDIETIDEISLEALAQHFGLSTRILDWSRSPYVAAFFAFSNVTKCETGMVSIWCLDLRALDMFSRDHLDTVEDFYKSNVRNLWQLGYFTRNKTSELVLENLFRKRSSYYDNAKSDEHPVLYRFDIPKESRSTAIDDLNLMRINSMTIFPGIEGVVRWIQQNLEA